MPARDPYIVGIRTRRQVLDILSGWGSTAAAIPTAGARVQYVEVPEAYRDLALRWCRLTYERAERIRVEYTNSGPAEVTRG